MTRLGEIRSVVDAARDTAWEVADRLRVPEQVSATARHSLDRVPINLMLPGWQPPSLLQGHPGIAALHSRLAHDDASWSAAVHMHLTAAARMVGPSTVGALLIPAWTYARVHGGCASLLRRGAELHASTTRERLAQRRAERARSGPGLACGDYDTVSGLAGQGRLLLMIADHIAPSHRPLMSELLETLVTLTEPVHVDGEEVPGWWCSPEHYMVDSDRGEFSAGDFNVGMAHGICGPLALLSIAHHAGHRAHGALDAIRRIVDWLLATRRADRCGPYWPGRVRRPVGTVGHRDRTPLSSRAGWCYGTSGVARALFLAGRALRDTAVSDTAVEAMVGVLHRPLDEAECRDPGFCHGRSGILQAAVRMAAETGHPTLWACADRLARGLIADFDPSRPFGFGQWAGPAVPGGVDNPGLINGAAGVALALACYADARDGVPLSDEWDAAFLLN